MIVTRGRVTLSGWGETLSSALDSDISLRSESQIFHWLLRGINQLPYAPQKPLTLPECQLPW